MGVEQDVSDGRRLLRLKYGGLGKRAVINKPAEDFLMGFTVHAHVCGVFLREKLVFDFMKIKQGCPLGHAVVRVSVSVLILLVPDM